MLQSGRPAPRHSGGCEAGGGAEGRRRADLRLGTFYKCESSASPLALVEEIRQSRMELLHCPFLCRRFCG